MRKALVLAWIFSVAFATTGTDLLSTFLQVYNQARQFYPSLPDLYLDDAVDLGELAGKLRGGEYASITVTTSKNVHLAGAIEDALRYRLERGPGIEVAWAMPRDEINDRPWLSHPRYGEAYVVARGEDVVQDLMGLTDRFGFSFMLLDNDLYVYTERLLFRVRPGAAGSLVPWMRLAHDQIVAAKVRGVR